MTGKQAGVMWLGLLLIVLRLFTTNQWATLKSSFLGVTSQGTSPQPNNDSYLVQAAKDFALPGSAAISVADAELSGLFSQPLSNTGKPVGSKTNPVGPATSPKAGAPGGSQG